MPTRPLSAKGHEALKLALQGLSNDEIARQMGTTVGTVHQFLHHAKTNGHWTPPEKRSPRTFKPVKLPPGASKDFLISVSSDVVPSLLDEAKRRNRPITPMLAAIITAAVDRGLVAELLDDQE